MKRPVKDRYRDLYAINEVAQIVFATLHSNQRVVQGKLVAEARVIPLTIDEGSIVQVEAICREHYPLIEVRPFGPKGRHRRYRQ